MFDEEAAYREKKRTLKKREDHDTQILHLKEKHETELDTLRRTHVHEDELTHLG